MGKSCRLCGINTGGTVPTRTNSMPVCGECYMNRSGEVHEEIEKWDKENNKKGTLSVITEDFESRFVHKNEKPKTERPKPGSNIPHPNEPLPSIEDLQQPHDGYLCQCEECSKEKHIYSTAKINGEYHHVCDECEEFLEWYLFEIKHLPIEKQIKKVARMLWKRNKRKLNNDQT